MFCNNCGKELIAGQQFCSACGQPVGVSPVPSSANRVRENIQILGILWLVYSGFALLGAIALWVVANVIFGGISRMQTEAQIPSFLHPLLSSIAFLILVKAALGLAAGGGLLQRASWARILALIAGFLALLNIPFGTALGIYTIWVLLVGDAEKQYQRLTQAGSSS